MRHIFLVILLLLPVHSFAQDEIVDTYAECSELLNSPPLDQLLFQNDGNDYGSIATDNLGESLLGVICSLDQIVAYFINADWDFAGNTEHYAINGPPQNRYESDHYIGFCKPRKLPWRLFLYYCEATAGIHLFEGRVTHIHSGFNL